MTNSNVVKLKPVVPCPVCRKPSVQAYHPFCSARCADIDLNRWRQTISCPPFTSMI
jgi:endogenous inhibitor of DNA gyrase (YacG/DUF329 family)